MLGRLFVLLSIFPSFLLAQGSSAGSSPINLPQTAREASLGQSVIVDSRIFSSSFINPANLFSRQSTEILFSNVSWIQDVRTQLLGFRFPFLNSTLGISISSNSIDGIEIRTQPGDPIGTFTSRFATISLSFASSISETMVLGFSGKYLYERMYVDQSSGVALDAGMIYKTKIPGLYAGASILNLGEVSRFRQMERDLPTRLQLGALYEITLKNLAIRIYPNYQSELSTISSNFNLGAEVDYKNLLAMRLGYQTGFDARGLTTGAGIHYGAFSFDYAFLPFSYGLGNAHLATISVTL